MTDVASAADVARSLADAMDQNDVSYAIGGAVALGFYAPPRATMDVDINIFLPLPERFEYLLDVLRRSGFEPDESDQVLRSQALEEGQFRGHMHGLRVDVFISSIDFYRELESRKKEAQLLGRPIWILGVEDLVILKLMFFRRKDLADVEALMRDQGAALDRSHIRGRLTQLVGEDDERVHALDEIERDVGSA